MIFTLVLILAALILGAGVRLPRREPEGWLERTGGWLGSGLFVFVFLGLPGWDEGPVHLVRTVMFWVIAMGVVEMRQRYEFMVVRRDRRGSQDSA